MFKKVSKKLSAKRSLLSEIVHNESRCDTALLSLFFLKLAKFNIHYY